MVGSGGGALGWRLWARSAVPHCKSAGIAIKCQAGTPIRAEGIRPNWGANVDRMHDELCRGAGTDIWQASGPREMRYWVGQQKATSSNSAEQAVLLKPGSISNAHAAPAHHSCRRS